MSDPVLDAYVAKHGAKPTSYTHGVEWKIRLRIFRSAWQEATLIERDAAVERVVTLYEQEEHEAPFLLDICNAIRGTKP